MGERALAVCERADGQYDVYYSQWGGSPRVISAWFRGVPSQCTSAEWFRNDSTQCEPTSQKEALFTCEWTLEATLPRDELLSSVDFLQTEAVYVISRAGECFLAPIWTGLALGESRRRKLDSPANGVLACLPTYLSFDRLRQRIERYRAQFSETVEHDMLSVRCGQNALLIAIGWVCRAVGARPVGVAVEGE